MDSLNNKERLELEINRGCNEMIWQLAMLEDRVKEFQATYISKVYNETELEEALGKIEELHDRLEYFYAPIKNCPRLHGLG